MNPYSQDYYNKQLKDFNDKSRLFSITPEGTYRTINTNGDITNDITIGNIRLTYKDKLKCFDNGFLTKSYINMSNVPILLEDDKVWMSITPMEIDSHWIPINLAKGDVGVAGLGLGYYVQNILDKPEVETVTVYEINQTIIDLYLENFGNHEKLIIKNENALEISLQEFDFFYNDIYRSLFDDNACDDMVTINNNNNITIYFFWGMEGFIAASFKNEYYCGNLDRSIISNFISLYEKILECKDQFYNEPYFSDDEIEHFLESIG